MLKLIMASTTKIHFASSAVSFYDIIKVGDDVNIAVINLPGYIDNGKIAYIEVAPQS